MLNKFMAAGRMTADPEIRTVGDNRLCRFSIACDRPKRKGEEKAETDFFTCVAWNRNADVIANWFGKGDMITLVGSLHNNQYEKGGQKYTGYYIGQQSKGRCIQNRSIIQSRCRSCTETR